MRKKTSGSRRGQLLIDFPPYHPFTQDGEKNGSMAWTLLPAIDCMAFSSRQIFHKMLIKHVGVLGTEEGGGDGDFSLLEHFIDNIKGFVINSTRN